MKALKKVNFAGKVATLFKNGDIVWADMLFPGGMGANAGLIAALEKAPAL